MTAYHYPTTYAIMIRASDTDTVIGSDKYLEPVLSVRLVYKVAFFRSASCVYDALQLNINSSAVSS